MEDSNVAHTVPFPYCVASNRHEIEMQIKRERLPTWRSSQHHKGSWAQHCESTQEITQILSSTLMSSYVTSIKPVILQIRWELQGLDDLLKPSHFSLGVKGALYPERQAMQSRLKGQLEMSISFVLPPVLALVPEDGLRSVAESVRPLKPLHNHYFPWFYRNVLQDSGRKRTYELKCWS